MEIFETFSRKSVTPTENKLYILSCSLSAQTSNPTVTMEKLKKAFAHGLIQFAYVCCSTFWIHSRIRVKVTSLSEKLRGVLQNLIPSIIIFIVNEQRRLRISWMRNMCFTCYPFTMVLTRMSTVEAAVQKWSFVVEQVDCCCGTNACCTVEELRIWTEKLRGWEISLRHLWEYVIQHWWWWRCHLKRSWWGFKWRSAGW